MDLPGVATSDRIRALKEDGIEEEIRLGNQWNRDWAELMLTAGPLHNLGFFGLSAALVTFLNISFATAWPALVIQICLAISLFGISRALLMMPLDLQRYLLKRPSRLKPFLQATEDQQFSSMEAWLTAEDGMSPTVRRSVLMVGISVRRAMVLTLVAILFVFSFTVPTIMQGL